MNVEADVLAAISALHVIVQIRMTLQGYLNEHRQL